MRRSEVPIGRIGYLHRSGRFCRDARGRRVSEHRCPGCRISEPPSRHFPRLYSSGRSPRAVQQTARSTRIAGRSGAATRRVTSRSGGYTSGRSTRTQLSNTTSTTSATRQRRSLRDRLPRAATPASSRSSRRPARTRTTARRSSRRRPRPAAIRARHGGTAGRLISQARHRTGGTRAAAGTTSPSSSARTTSRRRCTIGIDATRPPLGRDLHTGDAVPAEADPGQPPVRPLVPLPGSRPLVDRVRTAMWRCGSTGRGRSARVYGATLRNQNSPASSDFTGPGMYVSQGIYRHAYQLDEHSDPRRLPPGVEPPSSRAEDTPAASETAPASVDVHSPAGTPSGATSDLMPALWRAR